MKKLVGIFMAVMMIFAFTACGPSINKELEEYKANAITALEAYATEKGEDNYSAENWAKILQIVSEGKAEMDAAKDKTEVDTVQEGTKQEIDEVEPKEDETIPAVQSGFISANDGAPGSGYECAFTSDKKEYDFGDIELTFYYGLFGWHQPPPVSSDPNYTGKVQVIFWEKKAQTPYSRYGPITSQTLVREIDFHDFHSQKYAVNFTDIENEDGSKIYKYNHSERVVIPKEVFKNERGVISFNVWGCGRGSISVYYTLIDGKTTLYSLSEYHKYVYYN